MRRGSSVCLEFRPSDGLGSLHIAVRAREDAEISVPTDYSPGADFPHHGAEIDGGYTQSSCDTVDLWFDSGPGRLIQYQAHRPQFNSPLGSVPTWHMHTRYMQHNLDKSTQ